MPQGASASGIYLVGSDGSGLEAVWTWETAGSQAVYLVWSPDGRHLAFFGHDAGDDSSGLYVLDADQGSLTRLVEVGMLWHPPVWSSDGSQLYFSASSSLGPGGIGVVPADGSGAPTLLATDPEMARLMTISPDGQTVTATIGGPPKLAVMDVDDPQMRVIVDDLIVTSAPVWSPDSQQIAFIGQPSGGGNQLYVVNADGTGRLQLSDVQPPNAVASGGAALDPVWSPDGQQIAYTVRHAATPATEQMEVYVSAVDGSDTRNLSNDPEHVDTGPNWSPDAQEIAVVSQPAEAWRDPANASGGPEIKDIRVVMADGTNLRTVLAGVEFGNFMELSGLPEWRPTTP
jgi:Tol biopolymer transport system component